MALLIALPNTVLIRLVGGDRWSMLLLAGGILLAVALAGAALLALGAKEPSRATPALAAAAVLTVAAMLLLRDDVRRLVLRQSGVEEPGWVVPQWGPFALFAVSLVAAVLVIAWMGRALARGAASPEKTR
jgi:hypothetical protein